MQAASAADHAENMMSKTFSISSLLSATALAACLATFSGAASAGYEYTVTGSNDCAGYFGNGFSNCVITDSDPIARSIVKFAWDGSFSLSDTSTLFGSIDGSEFSLSFDAQTGKGTWSYTPGEDDPVITFFSAKFANNFILYSADSPTSGEWSYHDGFPNGHQTGSLSHITFYGRACVDSECDGGGPPAENPMPEPGALALLGIGLFGLGWMRRRSV